MPTSPRKHIWQREFTKLDKDYGKLFREYSILGLEHSNGKIREKELSDTISFLQQEVSFLRKENLRLANGLSDADKGIATYQTMLTALQQRLSNYANRECERAAQIAADAANPPFWKRFLDKNWVGYKGWPNKPSA